MDGIVVPSGGTRSSGPGWGALGARRSCAVAGIAHGLVQRFMGRTSPEGPGAKPCRAPWLTHGDAGILVQPRSRNADAERVAGPRASPGNGRAHRVAAHRGQEGLSRVRAAGRPCGHPRRERWRPAASSAVRSTGRQGLEQHAHNFPGVLGHLVQKSPIPLETFVPHTERREAESRKGSNVYRGTVMLPTGVMIMNSIAAGLTSAPAGTVGILPPANPRQVWPT